MFKKNLTGFHLKGWYWIIISPQASIYCCQPCSPLILGLPNPQCRSLILSPVVSLLTKHSFVATVTQRLPTSTYVSSCVSSSAASCTRLTASPPSHYFPSIPPRSPGAGTFQLGVAPDWCLYICFTWHGCMLFDEAVHTDSEAAGWRRVFEVGLINEGLFVTELSSIFLF